MSARRTLFVDDKGSASKGIPLTPTPPVRQPAALNGDAIAAAAAGATSPLFPRSSKQACQEAKLDNPIDLRSTNYHTSQQAALNAELRNKVEHITCEWERIVQATRQQLELLPEKASGMNYMVYNGLTAYDEGYGCTEELPMSEERLVSEFRLACTVEMLKQLQEQPAINVASIGASLDALLDANKNLRGLETFIKEISPLDVASDVEASVSAAAMHEKHHYPVGEALRQELSKNIGPIHDLEEKVISEKTLKEMALENRDVNQAGVCLAKQVELSNELLKLNRLRMEVVQMIATEVQEFDQDTSKLLDTVQAISETMQKNLAVILEPIQRDLVDCKKDKELAKQQLAATAAAFAKEQADARLKYKEYEGKEQKLWKQICDLFTELEMTVTEKKHFSWQRLLAKEKNSRQQMIESELLKTQEVHLTRLQLCEDYVCSAQRAAQQFEAFSEAFDAALRTRVQKHHDDLLQLQLQEASEYVRRYELFAFGAEEIRAKKQTRLDVMNLTKRNLLLDVEAAESTLDPYVSKYKQQLGEIEEESLKLEQYLSYLEEMQQERQSEVAPSTTLVSVFVSQQKHRSGSRITASRGGTASPVVSSGRNTAGPVSPRNAAELTRSAVSVGSTGTGAVDALADRVAVEDGEIPEVEEEEILHPKIAARHLGLMHEENVTLRAHDYVREELAAIESRMSDIRRAKTDNEKRIDSARTSRSQNSNGRASSPPLIYIPKS